ncbi:MAG: hypothetical protein II933_02575 [Candidatus Methanomethylophilaceae archaeon]|nr:hypothetical protein [Candidatus Methanomethylophilaceae archaeon]
MSANLIVALILIAIIGIAAAKVIYDFKKKNYCEFCGGNCGGTCEGCNACKGVIVPIEDDGGSDGKEERGSLTGRAGRTSLKVISAQTLALRMSTAHKAVAVIAVAILVASSAAVILCTRPDGGGGGEEEDAYLFETFERTIDENVMLKTYYTDDYFSEPSTVRNNSLMTFALCLELSCGYDDGGDGSRRSDAVVKLLGDIGCDRVAVNDCYTKESTPTSTDIAIGAKAVGDYTVLFVAINGALYGSEFASNMMLGASGDHAGFSKSARDTIDFLREFIQDNGIAGKAKILITGYSRAAAASNLMGAYLADAMAGGTEKDLVGDVDIAQEDVYCFGFETPYCGSWSKASGRPAPTDARYGNIWYTTNPDDLFTYAPAAEWGFCRYGNRIVLDSHDRESAETMLGYAREFFGDVTAEALDMSKFIRASIFIPSMKSFNEGFFEKLFASVDGGREYYHACMEEDFATVAYVVKTHWSVPGDFLDEYGGDATALLRDIAGHFNDPEEDFRSHFGPKVLSALEKSGCSQYADGITGALYQAAKVLNSYCKGSLTRLVTDGYVLTVAYNGLLMIMPHMPSMTLCYLVQDDPNYG